jgi:predicted ATPase/signal transduction histidine kinase
LNEWREKISTALGTNGRLIVDIVPEVVLIVGPQPPIDFSSPSEAQNRFNLAFQNFVRVFAEPDHPLVLFLDDLQWADSASLRLVEMLTESRESRHLLVIGAYRDTEVGPAHRLIPVLERLERRGAVVSYLPLPPLALPHISRFLVDSLKCSPERAQSLAELVLAKTRGNPFFMIEFLYSLYKDKLLRFVPPSVLLKDRRYLTGRWQWSTERIKSLSITDNAAELMADKILSLEGEARRVLTLAASVGNQFDIETLSFISNKPPHEVSSILGKAIAEGLILPVGDSSMLMELSGAAGPVNWRAVECRFAHDRIQQALTSLIPESERTSIHLRVGKKLLENLGADLNDERVFNVVNQLNLAVDLITSREERRRLAELNLIAGERARETVAYQQALRHLELGIELVGQGGWEELYDLTLALHLNAVEAAYLNTDFEKMESLAEIVLKRARTPLDKVRIYEIRMQACIGRNKLKESVQMAVEALELIGLRFPRNPRKLHLVWGLLRTKLALRFQPMERLAALPHMTDAHKLAAMRLLTVAACAFFGFPRLYPLLMFKMVTLSVKYGNAPVSPFAYASYGAMSCGLFGDIGLGRELGDFAMTLMEKLNVTAHKAKTLVVVNCLIKHWHAHLKDTLDPLSEAYRVGVETGDFEYASLAAHACCSHSFFVGRQLRDLEHEMASFGLSIAQLRQKTVLNLNRIYRQAVLNLMGLAANPVELAGESYDETDMLRMQDNAADRTTLFIIYFFKLMLCYLFEDYTGALKNAEKAEEYADGALSTYLISQFWFFGSLARLALLPSLNPLQRETTLRRVFTGRRKMKKWARFSPMNHLHKFFLLEAERCRALGRDRKALEYYDRALQLARSHDFLVDEALTNFLTAKFFLARGKAYFARAHMIDARYGFQRWGATAKVRDIDEKFGALLAGSVVVRRSGIRGDDVDSVSLSVNSPVNLDLGSVLKASQAISSEIVLNRLLDKLMRIVIENAGARKGFLILKDSSGLKVETRASLEAGSGPRPGSVPLENCRDLPRAILNYVSRTKLRVVLSDATSSTIFAMDDYVRREKPKSVLCLPLIQHGELTGILYLENDLSAGAFTPERVQVIELISAQAAISIEHARLYSELEKSDARRKFLSKRIIDLLETDRKRIAMELHDDIGQMLTTLKMDLEWIAGHSKAADSALEFRFASALEKAVQAIKGVREIAYRLRPSVLDNLGLLPSMQNLINDLNATASMDIHFFSRNVPKRLDPDAETAIYRVFQEALTNAIKHSQARHVHISFVASPSFRFIVKRNQQVMRNQYVIGCAAYPLKVT